MWYLSFSQEENPSDGRVILWSSHVVAYGCGLSSHRRQTNHCPSITIVIYHSGIWETDWVISSQQSSSKWKRKPDSQSALRRSREKESSQNLPCIWKTGSVQEYYWPKKYGKIFGVLSRNCWDAVTVNAE